MTNMPNEIILARIMMVLDLEFERALHYHGKGYNSDNDCDYQVHLWDLYTFTWFLWLRTPSALQTTRGHKVLPLHPAQGMSCFSKKQSADN